MNKDFKKSAVVTTQRGRQITQKIVFYSKKGTYISHTQCKECNFKGTVQAGLGYYYESTCDRDGDTWRRIKGSSDKECKFFIQKE